MALRPRLSAGVPLSTRPEYYEGACGAVATPRGGLRLPDRRSVLAVSEACNARQEPLGLGPEVLTMLETSVAGSGGRRSEGE